MGGFISLKLLAILGLLFNFPSQSSQWHVLEHNLLPVRAFLWPSSGRMSQYLPTSFRQSNLIESGPCMHISCSSSTNVCVRGQVLKSAPLLATETKQKLWMDRFPGATEKSQNKCCVYSTQTNVGISTTRKQCVMLECSSHQEANPACHGTFCDVSMQVNCHAFL